MADKRMMTKKVTDDDNFLSLSSSAQALYLHLSMSADDDGFCNQISISMFKAHASVQDLQALLEKRYIYQFDNGVIVIKHWRMANALRKDRYSPTVFQEELKQLRIKENGSYTMSENGSLPVGCQMVATGLPDGCHSIDKNRIDKVSKDKIRHKYGVDANVLLTDEEYEKLKREFPDDYEQRIDDLSMYLSSKGKTYKNHLATIRNWDRMDKKRESKKRDAQEDEQTRRIQAFLDRHKEDP